MKGLLVNQHAAGSVGECPAVRQAGIFRYNLLSLTENGQKNRFQLLKELEAVEEFIEFYGRI